MRVLVIGFYGWGNCGDEAILGGICELLTRADPSAEVEIATDIPFTEHGNYMQRIICPAEKRGIRTLTNFSMKGIDLVILGGGGLSLGYGYGLVTMAIHCHVPVFYFGTAIHRECVSSPIFKEFTKHFSAILPRSGPLSELMTENGIENTPSFCPSTYAPIADKGNIPENYVLVTPRCSESDEGQVDLLVRELQMYRETMPIVLVPFSRCDLEGAPVDLLLCEEIKTVIPEATIVPWSGYDYHMTRCLFKHANLVINTGRYHSALFAAQFGIPLKCSISAKEAFPAAIHKIPDLFTDFGAGDVKTWDEGFTHVEQWNSQSAHEINERGERNLQLLNAFVQHKKGPQV